jgi:tetratricopeptide (TPR) repeat protein
MFNRSNVSNVIGADKLRLVTRMPRQKPPEPTPEADPPSEPAAGSLPEIEAALQQVESVAQALQTGRSPRGRKPLRDAIRLFRERDRPADAFRAQLVLAQLEQRQGELERALTAARAAQRLAAQHPEEAWLSQSLELLARLAAEAEQPAKALEYAQRRVERARERGGDAEVVDALRMLVRICWDAGDTEAALRAAEEALAQAQQSGEEEALGRAGGTLGTVLLRTGCPHAAHHYLTDALRCPVSIEERIRLLLSRGSAFMVMGRFDSAARDYRRALRDTRSHPDRRLEVETTAALAAAEAVLGHAECNQGRVERALKLAVRAARRSRSLRDARLERQVDLAHETASRGEAALSSTQTLPGSPREAAGALVERAYGTESEIEVDACRREVERLSTLGHQTPPYRCGFDIPFIPGP